MDYFGSRFSRARPGAFANRPRSSRKSPYENYPGIPSLVDHRVAGDLAVVEMVLDYGGSRGGRKGRSGNSSEARKICHLADAPVPSGA
jgi:hypothetical protein